MNTDTNIITLDVGGRIFKTTRNTLIGGSEYFRDLFEDSHNNNEPLFIDRSYDAFEHVLNLLRNPTYKFPDQYLEELKYFGIKSNKVESTIENNCVYLKLNDGHLVWVNTNMLMKYPFFKESIEKHNGEQFIYVDMHSEIFRIICRLQEIDINKSLMNPFFNPAFIFHGLHKLKLDEYFEIEPDYAGSFYVIKKCKKIDS